MSRTVEYSMERKQLTALRLEYKIPRRVIADKIGLSDSFVKSLESGNVESREYNYARYVDALNKEVERLSSDRMDIFVKYLRKYLDDNHIVEKDFAKMCGISTNSFWKYRTGQRIGWTVINQIEKATGFNYDEITSVEPVHEVKDSSQDLKEIMDISLVAFPNHKPIINGIPVTPAKPTEEYKPTVEYLPYHKRNRNDISKLEETKRKIVLSWNGGYKDADKQPQMLLSVDQLNAIKTFLDILSDYHWSDIKNKIFFDDGSRILRYERRKDPNGYFKILEDSFTGSTKEICITREEFLANV